MQLLPETLLIFAVNFVVIFTLVRFIYYPRQRSKAYVFTFMAFSTVIFFVMRLLNDSAISLGAGFGLFAIFSILRYRTDTIPIREMTYLFVITALSVINSVLLNTSSYTEFLATNLATLSVLFVLEKGWGFDYEIRRTVEYEQIDLIRPEHWQDLIADLEQRLGIPVSRVEIGRVNFLRDSATLTVYSRTATHGRANISYLPSDVLAQDADD
ncbi:MAG: DUF4956 domain-containing protein [Anaerolineae bacterium]|nr:DUF4956 domain-containing protein [Anaerolineae bacterium]